MNTTKTIISNFEEIKTNDPQVKIKNSLICLNPYYFNYSFVINFISILFLCYALTIQSDSLLNFICYLLIGLFCILTFSELKDYNIITIDLDNKSITITPNLFLHFMISKKNIEFNEIKKIIVHSNINSSGFWMAYRKYYIIVILKNGEEIKLIFSTKYVKACKISEALISIFQ